VVGLGVWVLDAVVPFEVLSCVVLWSLLLVAHLFVFLSLLLPAPFLESP